MSRSPAQRRATPAPAVPADGIAPVPAIAAGAGGDEPRTGPSGGASARHLRRARVTAPFLFGAHFPPRPKKRRPPP